MELFGTMQLLGGILVAVGYVPQIIKILRTKSAEDFNRWTFLTLLCGIALMEVYAINLVASGSGGMFLVTNTLSLMISGFMYGLVWYFQMHPGIERRKAPKEASGRRPLESGSWLLYPMYKTYAHAADRELVCDGIKRYFGFDRVLYQSYLDDPELLNQLTEHFEHLIQRDSRWQEIMDDMLSPLLSELQSKKPRTERESKPEARLIVVADAKAPDDPVAVVRIENADGNLEQALTSARATYEKQSGASLLDDVLLEHLRRNGYRAKLLDWEQYSM